MCLHLCIIPFIVQIYHKQFIYVISEVNNGGADVCEAYEVFYLIRKKGSHILVNLGWAIDILTPKITY